MLLYSYNIEHNTIFYYKSVIYTVTHVQMSRDGIGNYISVLNIDHSNDGKGHQFSFNNTNNMIMTTSIARTINILCIKFTIGTQCTFELDQC